MELMRRLSGHVSSAEVYSMLGVTVEAGKEPVCGAYLSTGTFCGEIGLPGQSACAHHRVLPLGPVETAAQRNVREEHMLFKAITGIQTADQSEVIDVDAVPNVYSLPTDIWEKVTINQRIVFHCRAQNVCILMQDQLVSPSGNWVVVDVQGVEQSDLQHLWMDVDALLERSGRNQRTHCHLLVHTDKLLAPGLQSLTSTVMFHRAHAVYVYSMAEGSVVAFSGPFQPKLWGDIPYNMTSQFGTQDEAESTLWQRHWRLLRYMVIWNADADQLRRVLEPISRKRKSTVEIPFMLHGVVANVTGPHVASLCSFFLDPERSAVRFPYGDVAPSGTGVMLQVTQNGEPEVGAPVFIKVARVPWDASWTLDPFCQVEPTFLRVHYATTPSRADWHGVVDTILRGVLPNDSLWIEPGMELLTEFFRKDVRVHALRLSLLGPNTTALEQTSLFAALFVCDSVCVEVEEPSASLEEVLEIFTAVGLQCKHLVLRVTGYTCDPAGVPWPSPQESLESLHIELSRGMHPGDHPPVDHRVSVHWSP